MIHSQASLGGAGKIISRRVARTPLPCPLCSGITLGRRFPERADPSLSLAAAPLTLWQRIKQSERECRYCHGMIPYGNNPDVMENHVFCCKGRYNGRRTV